jgi:N,N'-diacetyllegionaminate synthase|tara:strand:- start:1166 stop:2170 length:1005 start_codon:yes stop_codon:yes gene_type:complete
MFKKKTLIIAEAGVNHNGNLKIAKKLIDAAKKCGADYVKFQTFDPNLITTPETDLAPYQKKIKLGETKQIKMLQKLSLTNDNFQELYLYCKKKKIKFLSSPFDIESINFLKNRIKMDFYKVPSGEINNYPYLKFLGKLNKKILLSTGMSKLKEINFALRTLVNSGTKRNNITIMHCISDYPTNIKDVNLKFIETLKKISKNVGFSDHTMGNLPAILAVALKAKIIEKHFTLNKKMKGPDHAMSLDINEFKTFVKKIRDAEIILGKNKKILTKGEKILKNFARKSLVAKNFIKKGERFNKFNLTTKRPGDGKSPILWNKIIGKKATKNFKKNEKI